MKKIILLLVGLALFQFSGINVKAQESSDSTQLSIDRIFNSGEFRQDWFGRYKWLGSGDYYTLLERSDSVQGGRDIVKYNTKTGKGEVMINAKNFIPENEEAPLRISN